MPDRAQNLSLQQLLHELESFGVHNNEARRVIQNLLYKGERSPDLDWRVEDHPDIDRAVFNDNTFMASLEEKYRRFSSLYQELRRRFEQHASS